MHKILDNLATHGLGENILLGNRENKTGMILAPGRMNNDWYIVDVRDMIDHGGNSIAMYKKKIFTVVAYLLENKRVVICCGAGQSRSNAIAIGVLVDRFGMSFYDALEFVKEKVPICNIDHSHIDALKKTFDVKMSY
ncbi:MAG: hypothetical protein ACPKPY_08280 [Nitrososphaeraceae archaeon]